MKKRKLVSCLGLIFLMIGCNQDQKATTLAASQNWTHYVRIAGHGLGSRSADEIVKEAAGTGVFGIEVDNSLTGYYESFLEPAEKLKAIKAVADAAHAAGNYAFVYTEGLETITANAEQKQHTFFKDHPDWVQRDIDGRPAVFGSGSAFWISDGDEDVWITPYATEWRDIFMQRIRDIAGTGIDGIFIDIPYWMTHFDGWEDTWASFDDYTVAAFKDKTGLDAKTDIKLGDYDDPNFIKWIDFRMATLTEFMREVNENAKSVNPDCKVIAEIYPGLGESAVRVGADVYEMYDVVDVVAHEFSYGGYTSAERSPQNWLGNMTGMFTFRAFAGEKATWMLTYSWDEQKKVNIKEAMHNLFMAQLMAGANCWDARGHVMSGSNDFETRKEVFDWIAEHEKTFYAPRQPMNPVGIYFSQKSRNYFPDDFTKSYFGMMYMMLQAHIEFQVVTPKTVDEFKGQVLIVPDARCLAPAELQAFDNIVTSGRSLIFTGATGTYSESRIKLSENPLYKLLGIDGSTKEISTGDVNFTFMPESPGRQYYDVLREGYNKSAVTGDYQGSDFYNQLSAFKQLLQQVDIDQEIILDASPFVASQVATVNHRPHIFIANFKGLVAEQKAVQKPEQGATVLFPADNYTRIKALPFLGEVIELNTQKKNGNLVAVLPDIHKGMVVWCE